MEKEEKFIDLMPHLRKCEYCRGKDGKEKDVYETFQSAFDTAKFIEENRGIYLNIYQCPHGNGWHLTKNNASSEIIERKETIFQNNNIPLKSSDGSWEYIREEIDEDNKLEEYNFEETTIEPKQRNQQSIPILKIECKSEINITGLYGKVMEIVENVDIEKIFGINIENPFCASMIKNILDGIVNQITIYVENKENKQLESYTILLKNDLLKNNKIGKGAQIKLTITGKSINNIKMWCCNKILK
jgi:hypothetical protein